MVKLSVDYWDHMKAEHWATCWAEWTVAHWADSKDFDSAGHWDLAMADNLDSRSVEWKVDQSVGSKVQRWADN
jgi:hypothetical protein